MKGNPSLMSDPWHCQSPTVAWCHIVQVSWRNIARSFISTIKHWRLSTKPGDTPHASLSAVTRVELDGQFRASNYSISWSSTLSICVLWAWYLLTCLSMWRRQLIMKIAQMYSKLTFWGFYRSSVSHAQLDLEIDPATTSIFILVIWNCHYWSVYLDDLKLLLLVTWLWSSHLALSFWDEVVLSLGNHVIWIPVIVTNALSDTSAIPLSCYRKLVLSHSTLNPHAFWVFDWN